VNLVALAINVGLNMLFFFPLDLGVQGLALGHAGSYVFASLALGLLVRRRLQGLDGANVVASIGRTTLAGLATAAVAWVVARWLGDALGTSSIAEQAVQVFGAIAAGLATFIALATLLRIEEVAMVRRQVAARWRS
jgi:peptidoglycan biosynthesis protein MviN/MurJ (putative lipid II flippase)